MRFAAAPWPALALAAGLLVLAPSPAPAQNFGLNAGDNNKPIEIEADGGIEWQQNNRVYIARGNAQATRGQTTVFADTLMAFYRPVCSPEAQAAAARRAAAQAATPPTPGHPAPAKTANQPNCPPPSATAAAPAKDAAGNAKPAATNATGNAKPTAANATGTDHKSADDNPIGGSSTEIYRMEADGHVRIATETQTIYGDHAVYDLDRALLVVTGKHLKLETPRDTVTARDDFEWYDDKQLAVARGNAVAVRDGKRLAGDVLTAEVEKDKNGSSHINRIDAQGNVLVSSADQIARGDAGVYNVDTGIATLTGRVTITRGDNELRGRYGVVDLNKNISRLLSSPPSATLTAGEPTRVAGLLVPREKPTPPGATKTPGATKAPGATKTPGKPAEAAAQ